MGTAELAITASSIDPTATEALHGVESRHRYRPIELIRSIARCDLFASGGGSLLQDSTSARSIFYYLAAVRIAQMMGKKTMFIAQGIGPLTSLRSQRLTGSVANRLDAITVRDEASAALLRQIGVTRTPITVTADPALLLGDDEPTVRRTGCAISLRPWREFTGGLVELVAMSLKAVTSEDTIASLDMHPESDALLQGALMTRLGRQAANGKSQFSTNYKNLLTTAASAEMVVGMRLHALIFAAASATPSVAIAYDPKVTAFMEQSGQGDAVFQLGASPDTLLGELIDRTWRDRKARAESLRALLPTLRAAAQRNADVAIEVVQ